MLVSLRRGYSNLVTSGGQLILLLIGFKTESSLGMFVCVALMVPLSLFAWTSAYRRARAVDDTPTSKVASAAQGYVELVGTGRPLAGAPLLSPLSHLPCLWFRYTVERKDSDNKWVQEDKGESDASFIVDDGSGECVVDPEGAEMLVRRCDVFVRDDLRYTQWSLIEHDKLYVIGDFATLGSAEVRTDTAAEVRELLAAWKADRPALLQRFALDGDGEIGLREWELARAQARREVRQRQAEALAAPELHLMRRPSDGRLYLISDLAPERIGRQYRWLAAFHAAVFLGASAATAWFAQIGVF